MLEQADETVILSKTYTRECRREYNRRMIDAADSLLAVYNGIYNGKSCFCQKLKAFRRLRRMTQTGLGMEVGFPEKSASVRIAQYESSARCPRPCMIDMLAEALNVSPSALLVSDVGDLNVVIQFLFALEDVYGFQIKEAGGFLVLLSDGRHKKLSAMLRDWHKQADLLERDEITKEDYDQWRYAYTWTARGDE